MLIFSLALALLVALALALSIFIFQSSLTAFGLCLYYKPFSVLCQLFLVHVLICSQFIHNFLLRLLPCDVDNDEYYNNVDRACFCRLCALCALCAVRLAPPYPCPPSVPPSLLCASCAPYYCSVYRGRVMLLLSLCCAVAVPHITRTILLDNREEHCYT